MTKRQRNLLRDWYLSHDIAIESIWALNYLTEIWDDLDDLRWTLEDFEPDEIAKSGLGQEIAEYIDSNDSDTAAYLSDYGGILIFATCALPDYNSIKFDNSGRLESWEPSGKKRYFMTWGRNFDAAICKVASIARRERNRIIQDTWENYDFPTSSLPEHQ